MKKRFRLKKAFSMIMFSYIAILLIPAALAVGFSVTANRMTTSQCVDDVSNNILQGQVLLEKYLDNMDAAAMHLNSDYTLKRMLQLERLQPGDRNVWFVSQFSERLSDIFADSSVLYAYSVLLKNEYVFHSNVMTQGREFFFQKFRSYEGLTAEEYLEKSFGAGKRTLLKLDRIDMGNGNGKVSALTYNYPIVTGISHDGTADAVVQFLIREDNLESFFLPLLQKTGSHVLLMDGQGGLLAVLTEAEKQEITGFTAADMADVTGSLEARLGEERALLVYRRSDRNNLIIAAAIPENVVLRDARRLRRLSFAMMGIGMLVELSLGLYFAWKYSSPIRNLVNNMYRMLNPGEADGHRREEDKSEYEHLESGVNQLLQTNQTMQITLREKQQRDFLSYLFSGEFRENEDICREGALAGLTLGGMLYCVVTFAMENVKAGEEMLKGRQEGHLLAVYPAKERTSILLGFERTDGKDRLSDIAGQLVQELCGHGAGEVSAGVGRLYAEEKDIHFSYMQSLHCVQNPGGMLTFYDTISQDFNALFYPEELENKLVNSTKHGEISQIRQVFSCIREENLKKRRLSEQMEKILISNMAATLVKVYNDMVLKEELEQTVNHVLRLESVQEALASLEDAFVHIGEGSARSRDEREEAYQRRLSAYMEQNYSNAQLGVAMAAEEFALSENYFSQFFKDVMKESFSSYLEKMRLDKAKSLIDEGAYSLEQIAGMVGYQNSGTFRRAFKRVTGISPSAWKNREAEDEKETDL